MPTDRCVSIAEGRVIVARVGERVVAFQNRCLHQASPLGGGMTRGGILTCPLHFWRYDLATGTKVGEPERRLRNFPVTISDGEVFVDVPPPPPEASLREFLLGVARGEIDPEDE